MYLVKFHARSDRRREGFPLEFLDKEPDTTKKNNQISREKKRNNAFNVIHEENRVGAVVKALIFHPLDLGSIFRLHHEAPEKEKKRITILKLEC